MRLIDNTTIRAQACEVPEGNGVWHFTRVGPFSTRGGYSWTDVATVHDESMHSQWRVSHEGRASLFVGDHVLGSADASGDLIGYPPLHQHHWHYFHASDFRRDFLAVHGDNTCPGRDGAYCMFFEYPNGSAFELVPQLGMQAEFNDVRPSGSPPTIAVGARASRRRSSTAVGPARSGSPKRGRCARRPCAARRAARSRRSGSPGICWCI